MRRKLTLLAILVLCFIPVAWVDAQLSVPTQFDPDDFDKTGNTISRKDGSVTPAQIADGNFGDWQCTSSVCSMNIDTIGPDEMADADHGDVSWSGGVATVENLQCTSCVADSELALTYCQQGGTNCPADDDVPEAGDYTNLTCGSGISCPSVGTVETDSTEGGFIKHTTDASLTTCAADSDAGKIISRQNTESGLGRFRVCVEDAGGTFQEYNGNLCGNCAANGDYGQDSVNLTTIHDGSDTPVSGQLVAVDSVTSTIVEYLAVGAGLVNDGDNLKTDSTEGLFLTDGGVTSLTTTASGKMQVMDDGSLQYTDGAATPVLRTGYLDADGVDDDVPDTAECGVSITCDGSTVDWDGYQVSNSTTEQGKFISTKYGSDFDITKSTACIGGTVEGIGCSTNTDCTGGGVCTADQRVVVALGSDVLRTTSSVADTQLSNNVLRSDVTKNALSSGVRLDFGAGELELPHAAGCTVDATGEACVDETSKGLKWYDGTATRTAAALDAADTISAAWTHSGTTLFTGIPTVGGASSSTSLIIGGSSATGSLFIRTNAANIWGQTGGAANRYRLYYDAFSNPVWEAGQANVNMLIKSSGGVNMIDCDDALAGDPCTMLVRPSNLSAAPTCNTGNEGSIYYDTDLNLPCMCNGTNFVQMDDFSTTCS